MCCAKSGGKHERRGPEDVTDDGFTRETSGAPNASVCLSSDSDKWRRSSPRGGTGTTPPLVIISMVTKESEVLPVDTISSFARTLEKRLVRESRARRYATSSPP